MIPDQQLIQSVAYTCLQPSMIPGTYIWDHDAIDRLLELAKKHANPLNPESGTVIVSFRAIESILYQSRVVSYPLPVRARILFGAFQEFDTEVHRQFPHGTCSTDTTRIVLLRILCEFLGTSIKPPPCMVAKIYEARRMLNHIDTVTPRRWWSKVKDFFRWSM